MYFGIGDPRIPNLWIQGYGKGGKRGFRKPPLCTSAADCTDTALKGRRLVVLLLLLVAVSQPQLRSRHQGRIRLHSGCVRDLHLGPSEADHLLFGKDCHERCISGPDGAHLPGGWVYKGVNGNRIIGRLLGSFILFWWRYAGRGRSLWTRSSRGRPCAPPGWIA
jgi:hypothetical protein